MDVSTKGRFGEGFGKAFADGLAQWWHWLVGDSSLPDKRSRIMLAGTVVVVLVLVFGLAATLRSPARSNKARRTRPTPHRPPRRTTFNFSGSGGSGSDSSDSGGSGGAPTASPRSKASSLPNASTASRKTRAELTHAARKAERAAARAKVAAQHAHKTTPTTTTTTTTPPVKTASSDPQPLIASTPALPDTATAATPAPTPAPSPSVADLPSAPTAPVLTKASAGNNSALITWTAPSSSGDSDISGYNIYMGINPGGEGATPVNGSALVSGTSYLVSNLAVGPDVLLHGQGRGRQYGGLARRPTRESAVPTASFQTVGTLSGQIVGMASNPSGGGYWLANAVGDVSSHGDATDYGIDRR